MGLYIDRAEAGCTVSPNAASRRHTSPDDRLPATCDAIGSAARAAYCREPENKRRLRPSCTARPPPRPDHPARARRNPCASRVASCTPPSLVARCCEPESRRRWWTPLARYPCAAQWTTDARGPAAPPARLTPLTRTPPPGHPARDRRNPFARREAGE